MLKDKGSMYPVSFWLKKLGQCALRKSVSLGFGLVCGWLFQGNQGFLLGLTVLFPVLLRLPPVPQTVSPSAFCCLRLHLLHGAIRLQGSKQRILHATDDNDEEEEEEEAAEEAEEEEEEEEEPLILRLSAEKLENIEARAGAMACTSTVSR